MDPTRFDNLAKVLATRLPRRLALGAGLAVLLGPATTLEADARPVHQRWRPGGRQCRRVCRINPFGRRCVIRCSGSPPPPPCPGSSCAGACVDLLTDPTHCGDCANVCPSGDGCRGGVCCVPDGQPCPSACASGGYCGGCCVEVCRPDRTCGAPPPCVPDAAPCPAGCAPSGDCPGCCTPTCRSDRTCGASLPPPCTADGDPCPGRCAAGGSCPGCCAGACAAAGVCGTVACQPYGGVCAATADCCDGVPCIGPGDGGPGHCHYP